jgi:L-aminopeptidase/D-esterase-like protein
MPPSHPPSPEPDGRAALARGFSVGHWTDEAARTGCTVVIPPRGNVTSCDVRGSSPGSRELALIGLEGRLDESHAVVLTGGSSFGLAAADGVASLLEERGVGYETAGGLVPIVPAAVIFDLAVGDPTVRPGPVQGRSAAASATEDGVASGLVGAGTGATVGKWAGREHGVPGGLGLASASAEGLTVGALAVVNSVGDVIGADGGVLAGTTAPDPRFIPPRSPQPEAPLNTVLGVVAVHADLDKQAVRWLAARGSDGVTGSVRPAHTRYDGDVVFAIAARAGTGADAAGLDLLGSLATEAMAQAVRAAVSA